MATKPILGIDIGGSGIKGAPVNTVDGTLSTERLRIPTPRKSTPKNCASVAARIVEQFAEHAGSGPIGVTVPGPVVHGVVTMMANLDQSWVGVNAQELFSDRLGRKVLLVNDADAAGVAEVRHGAAKDHPGVVIVTTLGTGIGSAIIHRGVLLPNTELGHLEIRGHDAETRASAQAKTRGKMSYKRWARRLQIYYSTLEMLFSPDLFVVGGGISRSHEHFLPLLNLRTPIMPAELYNQAGIVGAASLAAELATPTTTSSPSLPEGRTAIENWDTPRDSGKQKSRKK